MISYRRPSDQQVAQFLDLQSQKTYGYHKSLVKGTRQPEQLELPPRYAAGHARMLLGYGKKTFNAAINAVRRWQMFPGAIIDVYPNMPRIATGTNVALRIQVLKFWTLAACRIVWTIDTDADGFSDGVARFGFAYGTLPDHVEQGEERFLVEWRQSDDTVWYDLFAFSRPGKILTWAGMPLSRFYQRRFAALSCRKMASATEKHDC